MTDAQRDGADMVRRMRTVQEIGDDPIAAGREHFLGDSLADLRGHQRDAAARPSEPLRQPAGGVGKDDEAAFRAGHFERAVQHDNEHLVEHLPRPEGPQSREQGIDLAEVERRRGGRGRIARLEANLGLTEANAIAHRDRRLFDPRVVDERAET